MRISRRHCLMALLSLATAVVSSARLSAAVEDPGKTEIGRVSVSVYFATDGDPLAAGAKASNVSAKTLTRLSREERLKFRHYRFLGQDIQPLLRSYESWAQPLKPADDIMVRFEAQGKSTGNTAVLDLELWISRQKSLKTDAKLQRDKPLYVLGPPWRGGRLIVGISLAAPAKPKPTPTPAPAPQPAPPANSPTPPP
jgi:hypothetical protein